MERDLRIDTIRGLLLCSIGIEHMGVHISEYFNHMLGIFSFAAALVFLSGLVTGITCSKTYYRQGMKTLTNHALERFRNIYLGHIIPAALILGLAAVSLNALHYFTPYMSLLASVANGDNSLSGILLYMMAFLYQPNYFDIFPMFMFFMLLSPIFAYFIGKNQSLVIFGLSGALWLAIQLGFGHHWFNDWTINGTPIAGLFDPFAWQFLFLIAFYFGFKMHEGIPAFTRRPDFLVVCGLICLTSIALRLDILPYHWDREALLFSKTNMGILRLISFTAFVCLVAEFARHFPNLLQWRFFAFLGQHSLQVFAYQIVMIYISAPIVWRLSEHSSMLADAYAILTPATFILPALAHQKYRNWRRELKKDLALETSK